MIGQTLGQYRVLDKIGAGGMGVVYRAHDEQLDRVVALKVLPVNALADENARQRFRTEALALSRLNHPNICTIFGVGESDGQTYIAMEFVEGRPLSELARGAGLPADAVIRYGAQIADALAHAHDRQIVHRDLKGSNVIITPDGRAKVLDFGLARRSAPAESEHTRTRGLTEAGMVVGTLSYLPPEALSGQAGDERGDIWALGVVLHEMAAGQLPFVGQTGFEISSAILREAPAPLPATVGPGLRSVIQRCLAKQAGERYQRAGEVRAALEATHSSGVSLSSITPVQPAASRRRQIFAAGAVFAVLLTALALNVGGVRDRLLGAGGAAGGDRIQSLAVLPLENLSHNAEQDYFAEGMTEQLITDLSKIGSLRVISRTSVMQYKGAHKPPPAVAKELKVDAVVEGSVLRSGDRVRINARLIRASADQQLWAESYDRDLRDVLALQSEVAKAIAGQIRTTLTPQEQTKLAGGAPRASGEVHELYLKGRYYFARFSKDDLDKAIGYFQRAIDKDPKYAPAYAGLSIAYFSLSSSYLAPLEVMPKAKAAAVKAIELDDSLAEAHIALASARFLFDWDWAGAEKEMRRAIELNPSSADAHSALSIYSASMKRPDESLAELRRARELDPLSALVANWGQWSLIMLRRYDDAITLGKQTLELDPNAAFVLNFVGIANAQRGAFAEAVPVLEKSIKLDDSPFLKATLAWGYGVAGKRRQAEATIAQLKEIAKQRYVCSYEVAAAFISLGDKDQAMQWFEKSFRDRSDCMVFLQADPRLDPIRSDPRFQDLLRRVGFNPVSATLRFGPHQPAGRVADEPLHHGVAQRLRRVAGREIAEASPA